MIFNVFFDSCMRFMLRMSKRQEREVLFLASFGSFVDEMSVANCWSTATCKKLSNVQQHVVSYAGDVCLESMNEEWMLGFVRHCERSGLCNGSIRKMLGMLKWFLGWAEKRGYVSQTEWKAFSPKLKVVSNRVIFLTWDELMSVLNLQFAEGEDQLEYARDLFCLECFTSLRYSDVCLLTPSQVKRNCIEVVTKKTSDSLTIELNKYSRHILGKYEGMWADRAMPRMSVQWVNKLIKEVCRRAEVNERVHKVWYEGNRRCEVTKEKWELVSSHCGRRTFICNSLAMGIPPETVMKWTGHSNYNAMKPYIDIADSERRDAMSKWDARC